MAIVIQPTYSELEKKVNLNVERLLSKFGLTKKFQNTRNKV